ncbi:MULTISPECIES: hypothetical protein [Aerosakkonema]|uniref:hypothetical protein n=1 Tax=Aerosakkonema TaxID=1246629 RepID=UPI0035B8C989
MERGLIWLPLLALFIWLAWAGWNEFQKVEAYRRWASQFERAKYDIYAVLGQNGSNLTWGKPTRTEPVNLQTFSLKNVKSISLMVDDKLADLQNPPDRGRSVALEFSFADTTDSIRIPFTDIAIATEWGKHLQQELQRYS